MDIVEKLRDLGDHAEFEPSAYHEAANEIERLRAKVAEYELWLGRIIFGGVTDAIIEQVRAGNGSISK